MKKLTLDVDELTVDSFEAAPEEGCDYNGTGSDPSCCRTCEGDRTCFTINCC